MKKAISLVLALVMVFALAACSGSGSNNNAASAGNDTPSVSAGNDTPAAPAGDDTSADDAAEGGLINFDEDPYEVSIQFVSFFEENRNILNVEAALNEITLEKINCTVDIVPVFIGDLPTTTSLGVAGGEKLDIVAVGLTNAMTGMVEDELLLPLDDLLAERGQAALAVTADKAEAQKISGVTYGVTGYPYAARAGGFVYNKEIADEYGIEMHDDMTMEDFTAIGEILKEHGMYLTFFGSTNQLNYKFWSGGDYYGSCGEYGAILDIANSTEIVNVFDTQELRDYFKTIKAWNEAGFMSPGQLTDTVGAQEYFNQGAIFGLPSDYTVNQLASWPTPFEAGIVRLTEPMVFTSSVTEFMLGIAANCQRPDKAMDLINLIYSDPEVANLLQYGMEGIDYVPVEGEENVITVVGTDNEDHGSYFTAFSHFGDPLNLKIMAPVQASYYEDVVEFENEAAVSRCLGYTFDSSDFSAESGAISSVLMEKLPALNAGEVADVDAAVDDLVSSLKAAGIEDVIAANQAQLDAYMGN